MNSQEMRLDILRLLLPATVISMPMADILRDAERMARFVETGQAETPADALRRLAGEVEAAQALHADAHNPVAETATRRGASPTAG